MKQHWTEGERKVFLDKGVCSCYLGVGVKCKLRDDGRMICPYCRLPIRNQLDIVEEE